MRLATRTFLWSLLPLAVLLGGSFWAAQTLVLSQVRDELRSTAKDTQASVAGMRARAEQGNAQVLKIVAENAALKAGLQLVLSQPRSPEARGTLEDQIQVICAQLGFDFLLVSDADGKPLAAVMRQDNRLTPLDPAAARLPRQGYGTMGGRAYQATSVPIDEGPENLGILSVGQRVDLSGVPLPAVLVHNGTILASNRASIGGMGAALNACRAGAECDLRFRGESFLSLPMEASAGGYELRSVQSVDAATAGIQSSLRGLFVVVGIGAFAGLVFLSGLTSRSTVRPIMRVVEQLRHSAKTGEAPEFQLEGAGERIHEIRELTHSFNRAAASIRDALGRLREANVQFIESLASALDARDPYTAGHSRRVSQYAVAIAEAMRLDPEQVEVIRIGALLHDVGKIGISDAILLKPGKLTPDENALIQQHPTIGRKILEGVNGFQIYLPVVELHHENWDGTGYPHGLRAEETPIEARIVKIADAYDAMTSDRPYRKGIRHEQALAVFESISGSQLDPAVTAVFRQLQPARLEDAAHTVAHSLRQLASAVGGATTPTAADHEQERV